VVEDLLQPEGEAALRYRLNDGQTFKSPSAAGTAVTGKSCNGWAFWSVGEPVEKPAKAEGTSKVKGAGNAAPKPEKKTRARKERTVARDGNGHALPIVEQTDGSYECGNCGDSFPTSEEAVAHLAEAHVA
jgi:hypothetical protein